MPEVLSICPVCGAEGSSPDRRAVQLLNLGDPFGIRRCSVCGMRWLSPRPTEEELAHLYRLVYFNEGMGGPPWLAAYPLPSEETRRCSPKHATARRRHATAQLAWLAEHKPQRGRLLEVGAGHGEFLVWAQEDGWDVAGIEPSVAASERARHIDNLKVLSVTLQRFHTTERFDVIYASHVLEHLPDAGYALERIKELMAPGGVVLVEVPNQFESWARRTAGRLRLGTERTLYSIHHTMFFGPRQLVRLFKTKGFRVHLVTHMREDYVGSLGRRLVGLLDWAASIACSQGETLQALAWIEADSRP